MNHHFNVVRTAIAAATFGMATAVSAQTYTLMSPPLPWATVYRCTVTNVSNQSVNVQKIEIVNRGTVLFDGSTSCTGNLGAGQRCVNQASGGNVAKEPYCRVQYTGTEGALVASFYGNYLNKIGDTPGAVTAVPLQALKTFPLATAN